MILVFNNPELPVMVYFVGIAGLWKRKPTPATSSSWWCLIFTGEAGLVYNKNMCKIPKERTWYIKAAFSGIEQLWYHGRFLCLTNSSMNVAEPT